MSSAPEVRVDISSARTLGIVGSVLNLFLNLFPVLALVGVILIAIAVRDVSRSLERPDIWRSFLLFLVAGIVGVIALAPGVISAGTFPASTGSPDMSAISTGTFMVYTAAFVLLFIGAVFLRRSFRELSEALGIRTFLTVGTLYLAGLIGFLAANITLILASIALGSGISLLVSVPVGILVFILTAVFFVGNILLIVAFVRTPKEVAGKKP